MTRQLPGCVAPTARRRRGCRSRSPRSPPSRSRGPWAARTECLRFEYLRARQLRQSNGPPYVKCGPSGIVQVDHNWDRHNGCDPTALSIISGIVTNPTSGSPCTKFAVPPPLIHAMSNPPARSTARSSSRVRRLPSTFGRRRGSHEAPVLDVDPRCARQHCERVGKLELVGGSPGEIGRSFLSAKS